MPPIRLERAIELAIGLEINDNHLIVHDVREIDGAFDNPLASGTPRHRRFAVAKAPLVCERSSTQDGVHQDVSDSVLRHRYFFGRGAKDPAMHLGELRERRVTGDERHAGEERVNERAKTRTSGSSAPNG